MTAQTPKRETRNTQQLNVNDRHVVGYAIVWDTESTDLGGFVETIDRHALDGVLEQSDVLCLLNHDIDRGVLARYTKGEGSLQLEIDDIGLKYSFDAPMTALGDEVLEGIRRGDINSSSFAFVCEKDEWFKAADGTVRRNILKIGMLTDVSCVYHPAYQATSVVIDRSGYDAFIEAEKRNSQNMEDTENKQRTLAEIEAEMRRLQDELAALKPTTEEVVAEEERSETVEEIEQRKECDEQQEETKSADEQTDEKESDEADEAKENDEAEEQTDEVEAEADEKENKENRNNINIISENMNKNKNSFSLMGAINSVLNNRSFDEATERVIAEGRSAMQTANLAANGHIVLPYEMREDPVTTVLATKATHGAETVATEIQPLITPLRANMILGKAGATIMTGLSSNISLPTYKSSKCGWADEIEMAPNSKGEFSDAILKPRRIVAYLDISKMFLQMQSADAEALLQRDLINCIAEKIESTILGSEAGTDVRPAGLFNGVTADTTNFKYGDVVDMGAELESNNVNDYVFLANPVAAAQMKKTSTDAGSGIMVMSGGSVDGRPVYTSSAVVNKGLMCVDPKEIFIALFGGLDVVVDGISQAANGKVRVVVTAYVDALLRRPEAAVAKILK